MADTFLTPFIADGEINLKGEDFLAIKEKYTQEALADAFVTEVLENHSIRVPMKTLTEQEAREDFLALCEYKTSGLLSGETFTRYEYSEPLNNQYFSESTVGLVSSDYFQQLARFNASSQSEKSPCSVWTSERSLRSVIAACMSLKSDGLTRNTLRSAIAMRKYIASQFRPAIAKSIYEYYHANNVLDFCSGWGDRLAGFYASQGTSSYIGVDPNPALVKGYKGQNELYSTLTTTKNVTMYCKQAEEMEYKKDCVDFVFTSPPYFIAENYTYGIKDMTQSSIKYRKLDLWLEKFLFEALDRAWYALAKGGNMVINISDFYMKLGSIRDIAKICDPMHEFITKKLGGQFTGIVGMKLQKRPNCHSLDGRVISKDAVFCEPMWTYKKV